MTYIILSLFFSIDMIIKLFFILYSLFFPHPASYIIPLLFIPLFIPKDPHLSLSPHPRGLPPSIVTTYSIPNPPKSIQVSGVYAATFGEYFEAA